MINKKLKYIDLFSGAGGLSEGFIQEGYEPIVHVEIDENACKTLETRLVYHKLKRQNNLKAYEEYLLEKIKREDFLDKYSDPHIEKSIINKPIGKDNHYIFNKIDGMLNGDKVDLIIGGPPCQAYSLVGRARDKNKMKNDPRNYLYKEYAKFLKRYNPKVFVFENVMGLITAEEGKYFKNMKAYFKRVGYHLDYTIQNSEDFGVLQSRKRIILIGWQKGSEFKYPEFNKKTQSFTIKDLLSDLEKIKPGNKEHIYKYSSEPTSYLKISEIRNEENFVTQHIARAHNARDLSIYKIAINKWLQNKERLKYPDLPEELKTHKNQKSFTDRYKVVNLDGVSHTMVAHISKDGHHYIYPDSKQIRSLSVREAARIQSFPDNYYFEGGRTAAFKQIGNAVPPLMAKEIANKIKETLCQTKN
jgi:DNA (cytosine-5)-methyltransferase 1